MPLTDKEERERKSAENKLYRERNREKLSAYYKQWRAENRDKKITQTREWYQNNKEHAIELVRSYRIENKEKIKKLAQEYKPRRKALWLLRYGLTVDEYDAQVVQQGNCCAICGKQPKPGKVLVVDHDHKSGKFRGLLCMNCNSGIGNLKDDPELILLALAYMVTHDPEN